MLSWFKGFSGRGALALSLLIGASSLAHAQVGSDSGLPIPRFVSIKSGEANVRVGPGRDFRVDWVFTRVGLPVEIVAEFDNWRRIRDADGTEGWIFGALLSGRRTAVVAPWLTSETGAADAEASALTLRKGPSADARPVARLGAGVLGEIEECNGEWCRFQPRKSKVSGWLRQVELWGVYPGETFED